MLVLGLLCMFMTLTWPGTQICPRSWHPVAELSCPNPGQCGPALPPSCGLCWLLPSRLWACSRWMADQDVAAAESRVTRVFGPLSSEDILLGLGRVTRHPSTHRDPVA